MSVTTELHMPRTPPNNHPTGIPNGFGLLPARTVSPPVLPWERVSAPSYTPPLTKTNLGTN